MGSKFDKKGFLFFLKFGVLILIIVFVGKYGPKFAAGELRISKNNQPKETPVASLAPLKQISETQENKAEIPTLNKIHLGFVGDIMLDRGVKINVVKYGNGNYLFPFEKIG